MDVKTAKALVLGNLVITVLCVGKRITDTRLVQIRRNVMWETTRKISRQTATGHLRGTIRCTGRYSVPAVLQLRFLCGGHSAMLKMQDHQILLEGMPEGTMGLS